MRRCRAGRPPLAVPVEAEPLAALELRFAVSLLLRFRLSLTKKEHELPKPVTVPAQLHPLIRRYGPLLLMMLMLSHGRLFASRWLRLLLCMRVFASGDGASVPGWCR